MKLSTLGRCVDQPIILNKLEKKMPALLIGAGGAYGAVDTFRASRHKSSDKKKKIALKNTIIIGTTIAASLAGARGIKVKGRSFSLFNNRIDIKENTILPALLPSSSLKEIVKKQTAAVNDFLSSQKVDDKRILAILEKVKSKPLKPTEIEFLEQNLPSGEAKKSLFRAILPEPENLNSKEIFSEIGRLSLLGAIPVVGGVVGGITADCVTKSSCNKSTSNKIKEGFYQYFANIFLCNVGACAALFSAECLQKAGKIKPLSPAKKMLVIMTGITATGIVGGSYIANKLSQKIIDPLFNHGKRTGHKSVYDERKPELTDIALHADDIATAGVLSGFKWIEPALPLMYFVSGYRAGIGYRNNSKH